MSETKHDPKHDWIIWTALGCLVLGGWWLYDRNQQKEAERKAAILSEFDWRLPQESGGIGVAGAVVGGAAAAAAAGGPGQTLEFSAQDYESHRYGAMPGK